MQKTAFFWIFCLIALGCVQTEAASIQWHTNYDQAQKEAQRQHKPMLLFFTGSDWCGWCMKLKKEVFSKPEFADMVGDKYIFVELDYPMNKSQPDWQKKQNDALQKKYGIDGYPMVILVSPTGKKLGQTGYLKGGPKNYAEHLNGMISVATDLDVQVGQLDQTELAATELQDLYQRSVELGRTVYADKVLEVGLQDATATFFLAQKYCQLVKQGVGAGALAHKVRQELLERDTDNAEGQQLFVAVLDFQQKVEDKSLGVDEIIQPLVSYLRAFGESDPNRWKVEMTLAQFLLSRGEVEWARQYAQASSASAPDSHLSEVRAFLSGF